jgi:periplasmic protein TonB
MQTNNILSAELIDIIFDDRNKAYGAYDLRKTYSKRIKKALLVTTTFTALLVGGVVLAGSFKDVHRPTVKLDSMEIAKLKENEKPEIPPEQPKKQQEVQVKTEKFTPPVIKEDDKVVDPPPAQDELVNAQVDIKTKEGVPDDFEKPAGLDDHKGIVEQKVEKEPDITYTVVEVDARYPGNWKAFLERNLNPSVPTDNNAPAGTYSVVVRFVVDKEGNVSNIETLTNHGYGMEAEAIRAIKKASKWEPAIQNGYQVKAYRKQVITFVVEE